MAVLATDGNAAVEFLGQSGHRAQQSVWRTYKEVAGRSALPRGGSGGNILGELKAIGPKPVHFPISGDEDSGCCGHGSFERDFARLYATPET